MDGDGVNDLAVGANLDDDGGANRGAVHIFFMNTDGSVDSTVEINDSTANGPTLADDDAIWYDLLQTLAIWMVMVSMTWQLVLLVMMMEVVTVVQYTSYS